MIGFVIGAVVGMLISTALMGAIDAILPDEEDDE